MSLSFNLADDCVFCFHRKYIHQRKKEIIIVKTDPSLIVDYASDGLVMMEYNVNDKLPGFIDFNIV